MSHPLVSLNTLHVFLAQSPPVEATGEGGFPLMYPVLCIILTALFFLSFSISRDPRKWRRLYQSKTASRDQLSVNRNKRIDENLKRYGIIVAMVILLFDVTFFVLGLTYRDRMNKRELTPEERLHKEEIEQFKSSSGSGKFF